ncbi:MAG TPA: DUF3570 domain-containing protein [Labilithrix sp.]
MQLRRLFVLGLVLCARTASADDNKYRGSAEMTGYTDNNAVTVLTPTVAAAVERPTAGWGVNGSYLVDIVTAASPDIVSTATRRWTEVRHAGSLGGNYKPGLLGVSGAFAFSSEPDYLSFGGGATLLYELDEKNTTLSAGYGHSSDTIGRHGTPFSIFSRSLDKNDVSVGVSRVLDKATLVAFVADGHFERGDQSKPYRYVPMFTAENARLVPRGASPDDIAALRRPERVLEQLPLERDRYSVTARLLRRFSASTFRIEQRFYADTWALFAETTDSRWLFDLGDRLRLGPHVRVHRQGAVDFWKRAYVMTSDSDFPKFRTGDRELGALWNFTGGGSGRYVLGALDVPTTFALTMTADVTHTIFEDAIYVKSRIAGFLAIGVEVER